MSSTRVFLGFRKSWYPKRNTQAYACPMQVIKPVWSPLLLRYHTHTHTFFSSFFTTCIACLLRLAPNFLRLHIARPAPSSNLYQTVFERTKNNKKCELEPFFSFKLITIFFIEFWAATSFMGPFKKSLGK